MALASSNKTGRKKSKLWKAQDNELNYQGGWGMSVFLRGVILSIPNCQFISNPSMMNVQS